jgi:hypothetical protein
VGLVKLIERRCALFLLSLSLKLDVPSLGAPGPVHIGNTRPGNMYDLPEEALIKLIRAS